MSDLRAFYRFNYNDLVAEVDQTKKIESELGEIILLTEEWLKTKNLGLEVVRQKGRHLIKKYEVQIKEIESVLKKLVELRNEINRVYAEQIQEFKILEEGARNAPFSIYKLKQYENICVKQISLTKFILSEIKNIQEYIASSTLPIRGMQVGVAEVKRIKKLGADVEVLLKEETNAERHVKEALKTMKETFKPRRLGGFRLFRRLGKRRLGKNR